VAYSPDGRHIISASDDRTVKIWDAATGKEVSHRVWTLVYHLLLRALMLTCGGRDFLQEWTLTGHSNWVRSVAYSPDGKHIVSGSWDNTVKVWDAHMGKEVSDRVLTFHTERALHSNDWLVVDISHLHSWCADSNDRPHR